LGVPFCLVAVFSTPGEDSLFSSLFVGSRGLGVVSRVDRLLANVERVVLRELSCERAATFNHRTCRRSARASISMPC